MQDQYLPADVVKSTFRRLRTKADNKVRIAFSSTAVERNLCEKSDEQRRGMYGWLLQRRRPFSNT